MTTESQSKAQNNGANMEFLIRSMYPEADFDCNRAIDIKLNGRSIEIKSCQKTVTDNSNAGGKRSGRFVFSGLQHQELIENSGEYIFVVQENLDPILIIRAPAKNIDLGKFEGIKSVCWRTIAGEVIA